ncbi:Pimeloyl-ACP methyl ester carboxylesterase [Friedmanniella luteola]|uniref:Pimeloyl-ACP methyl ester carboxylesterase n=1 Tax=Friedmanniella luteola TaxID=546871 RepID=A0A1H1UZK3_9ACTN|nr:alpha/beta hydrolase [Friedmanniella luteola]SDS77780.1 Pimeloyl-ACP methyl ester carboxylesterase [Friedmanniella luteola]
MTPARDFILVAGLWLTGEAWAPVSAELTRLGHRVVVPALPGADDADPTATLDDQLAAVLAAVDAADLPVVVGHSAASTLAWLAADRRPSAVARVVMIGGFPSADGDPYADFFPVADGQMPFPGWEPFEGADARDLDAAARRRFVEAAVPVPAGVAQAAVRLGDERRLAVPVTLVCPEFSPDEARAWLAEGELPELARVADLSLVDVDSGHWPMLTRPEELARLLDALPVPSVTR